MKTPPEVQAVLGGCSRGAPWSRARTLWAQVPGQTWQCPGHHGAQGIGWGLWPTASHAHENLSFAHNHAHAAGRRRPRALYTAAVPFLCDPTFPPLSPSGARRRTLLQALGLALAPGMPALVRAGTAQQWPQALAVPGTDLRLFGKPESFTKRRMGVALARDADVEKARERAIPRVRGRG